ncbi:MAG: hypothetical protein ACRDY3_08390 [Acidimicrobiales bacterium]
MRWKTIVVAILIVALFPVLASGVAQDVVRAVLQAIGTLVGGTGG